MLNVATGTKWVLGNWKMNGRLASNQALLAALLTDAQVNVAHVGRAVPTVYMAQVAQALSGQPMAWGGQAVSYVVTAGDVSAGNATVTISSDLPFAVTVRVTWMDLSFFISTTPETFCSTTDRKSVV